MRAIGRRMEHKAGPDPALKAEIEHLHQRLAEMEPLQARVAELEERIDFTERLLAQGKDRRAPAALNEGVIHGTFRRYRPRRGLPGDRQDHSSGEPRVRLAT